MNPLKMDHWPCSAYIHPDAMDVPGGIFNTIYLVNLNSPIIIAGN